MWILRTTVSPYLFIESDAALTISKNSPHFGHLPGLSEAKPPTGHLKKTRSSQTLVSVSISNVAVLLM
jgi:hypothetical protein